MTRGDAWYVRYQRERKRLLKQDALVAQLGVTRRTVSRWENGGNYPDPQYRPALAQLSPAMKQLMAEIPPVQASDRRRLESVAASLDALALTVESNREALEARIAQLEARLTARRSGRSA